MSKPNFQRDVTIRVHIKEVGSIKRVLKAVDAGRWYSPRDGDVANDVLRRVLEDFPRRKAVRK